MVLYITSEEARKQARVNRDSIIEVELTDIFTKINSAVGEGKTSIYYFNSLSCKAKDKLVELGYTIVKNRFQRPGDFEYTISWN